MRSLVIIGVAAVLVLGGVGVWYYEVQAGSGIKYRTEEVIRDRLVATSGSTGTLQAQDVVDVGAQVQGKIIFIGKDEGTKSGTIDWGSDVKGPVTEKVTLKVTVVPSSGTPPKPQVTSSTPPKVVSPSMPSTVATVLPPSVIEFEPATPELKQGEEIFINVAKGKVTGVKAPEGSQLTVTPEYNEITIKAGKKAPIGTVDIMVNVEKPGTVLAQIDPLVYQAQRDSAAASLLSAKASVKSSQASVKSAEADNKAKEATLHKAKEDWKRAEKLKNMGGIQDAEYDQFKADLETAKAFLEASKANREASEAQLEAANAQVKAAKSNLRNAQTNLDYCTITAPVTGKIVDRRVNMGQTVVASLSAPSLFLIAKDISKLEIWATVNEVDVGKIQSDQDVLYTVDADPGRQYKGKVVRQGRLPYRLNATMTSNVVTYTVVVSVDNSKGVLKPYMTTNLSFIVEDKENALLVSNAALRWQPAKQQIAPEQRESYFKLKNMKRDATDPDAQDQGFIWTQEADGFAHYTHLRLGMSDGTRTEIMGVFGEGKIPPEKTQVIVGESKGGARSDGANPFAPQLFKQKPKEEK